MSYAKLQFAPKLVVLKIIIIIIAIALLDLKNAFGEIHHNLIAASLQFHHVPTELIQLFKSSYANNYIVTLQSSVEEMKKLVSDLCRANPLRPIAPSSQIQALGSGPAIPYGSTPCISHVKSMWFCVKHMWNTRKNVCFTCFVRNTHENTCGSRVSATNSTCEPHVEDHVIHMWNLWRSHVFHM